MINKKAILKFLQFFTKKNRHNKHSCKSRITDEFILLNNKIKDFELLRLSATKAIQKGIIKFENSDSMLIAKGLNLMVSVKNEKFKELSKFAIENKLELLDVNQFIINKLKNTYHSFYTLVVAHDYIFLGEKWKNIPIIEASFNQCSSQSIKIDMDGKTIEFPFQIDDLKDLEFYTSDTLPSKLSSSKLIETKLVNTRRVKKTMLLRVS